ncbi:hypothetical protein AHiyo8_10650 [Arthrobacter sp. Hiyo8]|nr:hypothetical protein AHiyo8_10650 [Arthrobacter sp. Hiyo8]
MRLTFWLPRTHGRRHSAGPAFDNRGVLRVHGVAPIRDGLARDHFRGPGNGLLHEIRGFEDRVGNAQLESLGTGERAVVAQRILDHDLDGVFRADESRQDVDAAPTRDEPDEGFGQSEGAGTRRDRAVRGLEGDFEAASEREAVDEGEAGNTQIGERRVDIVAQLRHPQAVFPLFESLDRREVRAGHQEVWLACDADADDLAARSAILEAFKYRPELDEGIRSEGGGLGVVQAVVEGDQGERSGVAGEFDVLNVGVGHGLVREQSGQFLEFCGAHAAAPLLSVSTAVSVSLL